jgi:hypothetical protein
MPSTPNKNPSAPQPVPDMTPASNQATSNETPKFTNTNTIDLLRTIDDAVILMLKEHQKQTNRLSDGPDLLLSYAEGTDEVWEQLRDQRAEIEELQKQVDCRDSKIKMLGEKVEVFEAGKEAREMVEVARGLLGDVQRIFNHVEANKGKGKRKLNILARCFLVLTVLFNIYIYYMVIAATTFLKLGWGKMAPDAVVDHFMANYDDYCAVRYFCMSIGVLIVVWHMLI